MNQFARSAPAVLYPVRRSRFLGGVLSALGLLGAAVLAGWMLQGVRDVSPGPIAAAAGLWLLAAGCAFHFWYRQSWAAVRWDGQAWALIGVRSSEPAVELSGSPGVFLDLQSHLWVQVVPAGQRPTWVWLARSAQPERWLDLRRAVYSRAKPGVDPDATVPAGSRGV